MKSVSIHTTPDLLRPELDKLKAIGSQIVILFSSGDILENGDIIPVIRKELPDARLIGCSTSGEIGDAVEDNSVSLLGIHFDNTEIGFTAVPLGHTDQSYSAGQKIAENLMKDGLKAIFVLAPGLNINGSEFTSGIKSNLPHDVYVSGGLAGDGTNFKRTCVVLDDGVSDCQAVAFGLYGEHIKVHSGSSGGWKPFGPLRRVTRADKNILYELDGKPALALYKEYLGDKADNLPGSGLLYPFAIMEGESGGVSQKGLIRTILGIDESTNSLIMAGNMDVGSIVSLMHAGTDDLAEGARSAAEKALDTEAPDDSSVAICVSCVGRRILMGEDTEEELDSVRGILKRTHLAGFYSYGEICHHEDTNEPELHNQTMTITYITEDAA